MQAVFSHVRRVLFAVAIYDVTLAFRSVTERTSDAGRHVSHVGLGESSNKLHLKDRKTRVKGFTDVEKGGLSTTVPVPGTLPTYVMWCCSHLLSASEGASACRSTIER